MVKTLCLDIETSPNLAHVWGMWNVNVGLPQLLESGEVLMVGAKWAHEDQPHLWKGKGMLRAAYKALDQADLVVGFNHVKFDIPWLQSEFARAGMTPPSPYATVDLCNVVKAKFRFPSNKLQYVAGELLGESKLATGGHELWIKVMAGDRAAIDKMAAYCLQDVLLTERLFERLKPWCKLPNHGLYNGDGTALQCPQCGSDDVIRRGLKYTDLTAYVRYSCKACGRWSHSKHAVRRAGIR